MQLFIKTLSGLTLTMDVESNSTVDALKAGIENQEFIPASAQRLVCAGVELEGSRGLSDYGVGDADTIVVLAHVNGGMRQKWRKKRMRRLKRKRRKMRQRAR